MPSEKITAMGNWAGGQVSTDLMTGVDLSLPSVDQNVKTTLNDLFSIITKNITDLTVRYQDSVSAAPAVSSANTGAFNYNGTRQTFQGSRNGSAYADLLFGTGAVTQIAYWTSLIDQLEGNASWTYTDSTKAVLLTNANSLPVLTVQNSTAATPALIRAAGGQNLLQVMGFSTQPRIQLITGASGPSFPGNGASCGQIDFFPASDTGIVPTSVGGVSLRAITTQAISAGNGGTGFRIDTAGNGEAVTTTRFLINQHGACVVGANGQGVSGTYGGTSTGVVLGQLTTYNANASIQCGNPAIGNDNITFLIQGNLGQTEGVFRLETSAGALLYLVGIAGTHTYGATTGVAVSPAGQGRIYYDSVLNKFQVSQNGGAYVDMISAGGAAAWSALTAPVGNLSLAMAANLTAFTWGSNYGASIAFDIQATNTTATGAMVRLRTGISTLMPPLVIEPRTGQSFKADHLQSLELGKSDMGASDTDGFVYIPKVSGNNAPSGTPTTHSGWIPMVFEQDAINGEYFLWAYLNGAWRPSSHMTSAAYTPTNVTTDRSFDADTVAITELADVVGTLIADLQAQKILG